MEQAALLDALQASEERFRLAADFAYDWEYWEGPDGRFVYVSPSCARITGYSADEFIQDPQLFTRLVHPDDREILEGHRNQERNDPGAHRVTYRIVHRDGRERWIAHVCQRIYDPSGVWLGWRGSNRDITDHKQAGDALRESQAKLQALFTILPVGISILDAECRIHYTNPALSRILDLPPEELEWCRHPRRAYLKPDGSPMAPDEFPCTRAFREQRAVRDVEMGIVKEDGTVIWTNVCALPLPFADWSVITVTSDVTEKVQARRQVEEHAALLDTMLTSLAESVILYGPDARIVRANRAARELFRFWGGAEEHSTVADHVAWSKPFYENGKAIPLDETPAMRALRGETVNGMVLGLPLGEESSIWLSASAAPVYGPDGALLGALVSLADITELRRASEELERRVQERTAELWTSNQALQSEILVRRQAEADLRESELRFRQLAENVDEVFCLWEAETGRALYVSPSYETLWGRPIQEAYSNVKAALEGVHPEDRERVRLLLEDNSQNHDDEFRVVRPDGSVRWVRSRTFAVEAEDGEAPRIAAIASDITGQKETQATMMRAARLKTSVQLAASLAHAINNPLQSAIGCLDLAMESMERGRDPKRYFDIVSKALEEAAGVVAQLRSLHGQLGVEERYPVDLGPMLEQVVSLTQRKWRSQGVAVSLNLHPDLPTIALQADAMQQVFLNLVNNALDAMPGGGELRIVAERSYEPGGVWIRFADTGAALSAEAREHLFDPLYTANSEGLGLGLFISQNIVHQHAGHIEFESQEGQGTVFSVWLPS